MMGGATGGHAAGSDSAGIGAGPLLGPESPCAGHVVAATWATPTASIHLHVPEDPTTVSAAALIGVILGLRNLGQQGMFLVGGTLADRLGYR